MYLAYDTAIIFSSTEQPQRALNIYTGASWWGRVSRASYVRHDEASTVCAPRNDDDDTTRVNDVRATA